jgi:hypothetical protein
LLGFYIKATKLAKNYNFSNKTRSEKDGRKKSLRPLAQLDREKQKLLLWILFAQGWFN